MKEKGLISTYTTKQYRRHNDNVNEDIIANVVNRKFDNKEHLEIIVSNLTYVRMGYRFKTNEANEEERLNNILMPYEY